VVSGREVLANNVKYYADNPLTEIIIADESGAQVATIPVKDLLPDTLKDQ
jgi:hypothetical protein